MSYLGKIVGGMVNRLYFLTAENPFDAFKGEGAGIFDTAIKAVTPFFKDAYLALIIIGICLMVLAGLAAITVIALSNNDKKVAEKKSWLLRIIICAGGLGLFLAGISLVWKIATKINTSLEENSDGISTTTAQVREIPYHEEEYLF